MRKLCIIHRTGRWPYEDARLWQRSLVQQLKENPAAPEHLILLEHPPVFTIGRSGTARNILCPRELLRQKGIEVFETERGGDITYHGPGQIVGYPILRLSEREKDIHLYLRQLEEVIIRCLRSLGIDAGRDPAYTGVWTKGKKICAIGIAISRWITFHGWALNLNPDLSHFALINPCGITDRGVTSLYAENPTRYNRNKVEDIIIAHFSEIFRVEAALCEEAGCRCREHPRTGEDKGA